MPSRESGFVRDENENIIGEYREVTDEDGNTFRREEIDNGNGTKKIVVETMDGIRKERTIDPGGGSTSLGA